MADESPEQIRERVHSEELAKGSDPRIAEGRAKAAEARARHGLPIEPQEAWPLKLQREGGGAPSPAPAAEPQAPQAESQATQAEPQAAPAEPAPEQQAEAPASPSAPAAQAARAPVQAPAPPAATVERAGQAVEAVPSIAAAAPAPREAHHEPEIGERVEVDTDALDQIAGVRLNDSVLPKWLLVALLVIPLLAATYLLVFSGSGDYGTSCRVGADQTLTCFVEEAP